MTIVYKTVHKDLLDMAIRHIQTTLAETEESNTLMEYAAATGKCRGQLECTLAVLQAYADDDAFNLN